jgi:hypothetical protein
MSGTPEIGGDRHVGRRSLLVVVIRCGAGQRWIEPVPRRFFQALDLLATSTAPSSSAAISNQLFA